MKSTFFFMAIFGLCLVNIMARPQYKFDNMYNERNLADEDESPRKRFFKYPRQYFGGSYHNTGNGNVGGNVGSNIHHNSGNIGRR